MSFKFETKASAALGFPPGNGATHLTKNSKRSVLKTGRTFCFVSKNALSAKEEREKRGNTSEKPSPDPSGPETAFRYISLRQSLFFMKYSTPE